MLEINKIHYGDCLELMKEIEDGSIDLIIIDPPYNIKKDNWDDIKNYEEWMKKVILELQRVLKDNGSFYMFHSEMEVVSDFVQWLKKQTNFIFRQFIVWNKRFYGSPKKGFLDGFVEVGNLRNYQQMAEYVLYYTFQDKSGLNTVMLDTNNFSSLRQYFKYLQEYIGLNLKQINSKLGHRKAEHCFYWKTTQWDMPTKETYLELINKFNIDNYANFMSYEDLRLNYEDLRFTFNNQKTHHSVWNYDIEKKIGHTTPKPLDLIKNIILHSSNENHIVLDCFMGSGTTALACKQLNRNFIGIEKEQKYVDIANKRLQEELAQTKLKLMPTMEKANVEEK